MEIVPFMPSHLDNLLLQPAQAYMRPFFANKKYGTSLAVPDKSFAALDGDRVLACAGVLPLWEGRAEAWALLSPDLKRNFVHIHFATARFLGACGIRRIEAHVDAELGCAKRWVEMLGFEYEGPLRSFTPDGRDCLRYARVS